MILSNNIANFYQTRWPVCNQVIFWFATASFFFCRCGSLLSRRILDTSTHLIRTPDCRHVWVTFTSDPYHIHAIYPRFHIRAPDWRHTSITFNSRPCRIHQSYPRITSAHHIRATCSLRSRHILITAMYYARASQRRIPNFLYQGHTSAPHQPRVWHPLHTLLTFAQLLRTPHWRITSEP